MKILLAVDPPGESDATIAEVGTRPWPSNTSMEVLSVVEPSHVWDVPSLIEGLEEAARGTAEAAAEQLRTAGYNATANVLVGDAEAVIVDRARELGVDLIVVGSRGSRGLTRFLLGSVAAAVARFAPCSVEIVRAAEASKPPHAAMKILLATDGSEYSQLAARSIAERPWPAGTSIRALSVAELSLPLLEMPYFLPHTMEKLRGEAMQRAEQAEMAAEEILAKAGLEESGTVAVPTGTPKEVILENAEEWGADLIVCGSHGRRGLSRFLLGSVSAAVATHAKCSVEIIRRPGA
ncbi:MAG TPA: universal stress protein [Bryobacteraceae bacterium]|nr:universal stress protein [Bryobacteraceae bacterium]